MKQGGIRAALLLSASSACLLPAMVLAQENAAATPPNTASSVRYNTTGRDVTLTVPLKDGANYLGDVPLMIQADDSLHLPTRRTLQLLALVLDPRFFTTIENSLSAQSSLTPADFAASGIKVSFDPKTLELQFDIPAERRASRSLIISPLDRDRIGTVMQPADVSAYVNIRSSVDYVHAGGDNGFASPLFLLDGAARIGGVVAESEALWQPGVNGVDFQRLGSRLVYDDMKNLVRWTAGDLRPVVRGFQNAPDIAGLSIFRSYSVLQPQQIIRPRGDRSFRLDRPSMVEVEINGQMVRRIQLNPGTYDLRDFPFAQGANNVRLSVLDDSGRSEILNFNLFLDQTQLAKGLSEFGLYAGVKAPLGLRGPHYSNDLIATGFFRRGVSDRLTLGVNAQIDKNSRLLGTEAVVATSFGAFATNLALSDIDGLGTGYAGTLTFQRLIQRRDGQADTLNLFVETRSRKFGPVSSFFINNPYDFEIGGGYSHAFTDQVYAGFDGRFSHGRGTEPNLHSYRLNAGYRISPTASLTGDVRYEKDTRGDRVGAFLSLTIRFGRYSSARADYDTRDNRARISYQTLQGQGVGSFNVSADVERSDNASGFNFNGNYIANRAELGLTHFASFTDDFGRRTGERTSLRLGTSIAFADGAVSIGRPIYDSFAIVDPHKNLKGADIRLDPSPFGYTANTGSLGAATHPGLSSYAERTITVDAPEAAAGADLGQGSFKMFPPYRSGYHLTVGSDYSVTAIGTMVDVDGEPVALVTGSAIELAHPDRPPVVIFTNRQGRFGATGLAPGKWRIEMQDGKKSVFEIDIPDNDQNIVRLDQLTPVRN